MAKKRHTIELNGKHYDALTGELLTLHKPGELTVQASAGTSVDGFLGAHKPVVIAAPAGATRKLMDVSRPTAQKLAHHLPKKSQTLMRTAVKKPDVSLRRKTKVVAHTHALVAQPKIEIVKKLSHPTVDLKRAGRAQQIARSQQVARYASGPKQPKPVDIMAAISAHQATHTVKPVHASAPAGHAVQAPQASSSDVFERALERANSHLEKPVSHKQKKAKRRKTALGKRAFSASMAILAVISLAGFFAYQNQANLTIRYASSKAGFVASLPTYQPQGFKPGGFSYSAGSVAVRFSNPDSGQSFSLIQKQSNWDSRALLDDYVAAQSSSYHAVQSAGRTIYTYGDNNATWVNSGVWYQLDNNGSLTTNQLVDLAASM